MKRLNEVLRVLDGIAERFSEMKSTATNNCLYANKQAAIRELAKRSPEDAAAVLEINEV